MKKFCLIVTVIIIIGILLFVIAKGGTNNSKEKNKINIVASNFACYDFIRAIIGDNDYINLEFLLGAGKDTHSYDPTASDIIKIQNSDLYVYIGGEIEKWSNKVVNSLENSNTKILCIADFVNTIQEKEIDRC